MNNDILKEFLKLYTHLPSGVIIFKERSPYFINNHLRNVLTLGNIGIKESFEIVASVFGVEPRDEALYDFLTSVDFFQYKTKHIQINYTNYENYSIFVFTKIDISVCESLTHTRHQEPKIAFEEAEISNEEEEPDLELLEYFSKHHNAKVTGYVLYKGVPLISENRILKPYKDFLAVAVESKQMIATKKGARWVMLSDSGTHFEGKIHQVDNSKRILLLSGVKQIEKSFINRELIRYEVESLKLEFVFDEKRVNVPLVELAENSLKVVLDDSALLKELRERKSFVDAIIDFGPQKIALKCKFFRLAGSYEKKRELVCTAALDKSSKELLRKWLNAKQLKIIQEVREYSRNL
jgi:uncharacterized protein YeeX (DUF496 family)